MQGQSSPVQVKDPYTGSILMHEGSSCKTHRSVQCTPPKNNQKFIDGSNRKTKKKKKKKKKKHDYYKNKTPHVSALNDHSQHLKL